MAKFEGQDRLNRRLEKIPERVKKAAKSALNENARELVAAQKRLVPVKQGKLANSIRFEPGRHELSITVRAGGSATTKTARGGSSTRYDYALAQEFGTSKMPASPFFFPAYRMLRRRLKSRVTRSAKKAIHQK